jgi:hypothetical protein
MAGSSRSNGRAVARRNTAFPLIAGHRAGHLDQHVLRQMVGSDPPLSGSTGPVHRTGGHLATLVTAPSPAFHHGVRRAPQNATEFFVLKSSEPLPPVERVLGLIVCGTSCAGHVLRGPLRLSANSVVKSDGPAARSEPVARQPAVRHGAAAHATCGYNPTRSKRIQRHETDRGGSGPAITR